MFRLLRLVLITGGIYLFLRIGYPEPGHGFYHVLALVGILTSTVILSFALAIMDFALERTAMLIEFIFIAVVFVGLGLTMPARKSPPLVRIFRGDFPNQTRVSNGIYDLGFNPKHKKIRKFIELFPK